MNSTLTNFRVSRIFTSNIWAKLRLGGKVAYTPRTRVAFFTRSSTAGELSSQEHVDSVGSFWLWCVGPDQTGLSAAEEVLQRCGLRVGLPRRGVQRPPAVLPWVSLLQTSAHGPDWWTVRAQPSRPVHIEELLSLCTTFSVQRNNLTRFPKITGWFFFKFKTMLVVYVCGVGHSHNADLEWSYKFSAGLFLLRQTLRTLEPVDELKKGPFTLQASVLIYRQLEACVEVDIHLSASSRTGSLVWESVLTLVSQNKPQEPSRCQPRAEWSESPPKNVRF